VGRSTATETKFRVDAVYKLLSEAWSRQQILLFAATEWGVSQRMADEYIARARELLLADAEMQRPAWLAEALGRLRNYEQQAARRGQMQVAINALGVQAKLIGIEV
jgi:allantoicase